MRGIVNRYYKETVAVDPDVGSEAGSWGTPTMGVEVIHPKREEE